MNNKKTVLVVDDSKIVKNVITKSLEKNYNVIQASDGKEAQQLISVTNNIYALLLDLNMPEHSGFYVLDYLKQNNLFKKINVFIISGDDSKETIKKAFEYPIIDMIPKPFSLESIESKISKGIID